MMLLELAQAVLLLAGCFFYAIGTLGLFRFPDTLTRIHALTKVDNLGLGLIVLALLPFASHLAAGTGSQCNGGASGGACGPATAGG